MHYAECFIDVGDLEAAEPLLAESRAQMEIAQNQHGLSYLDRLDGIVASFRGDDERALELSRSSASRARASHDLAMLLLALQRCGDTAERCGLLEEAADAIAEALQLSEGLTNNARRSLLTARLGSIRAGQGRAEEAVALSDEAVRLSTRQNWRLFSGLVMETRGSTFVQIGQPEDARAAFVEAVGHLESVGAGAIAARVNARISAL